MMNQVVTSLGKTPVDGELHERDLGILRPEAPAPLWENRGRPLTTELPIALRYRTWGKLNAKGDNAVLVIHALTGNADAHRWWEGLFGAERWLDPEQYFIVSPNLLGSCYGSTGPASLAPDGTPWGERFPRLTPGDQVEAFERLRVELGIERWQTVAGGSLGGFIALEYLYRRPAACRDVVVLASAHRINVQAVAYNHLQRRLITDDPAFPTTEYQGADDLNGLKQARIQAMLTYRSFELFEARYRERGGLNRIALTGYLDYQGQKLADRFDPASYLALTACMDAHDLERHGVALEKSLADFALEGGRLIVVSYTRDLLFPAWQQHDLVRAAERAGLPCRLLEYDSVYGHDAFLADTEALNQDLLATQSERWSMYRWSPQACAF